MIELIKTRVDLVTERLLNDKWKIRHSPVVVSCTFDEKPRYFVNGKEINWRRAKRIERKL